MFLFPLSTLDQMPETFEETWRSCA